MAFTIRNKQKELVRLYGAGTVGGGVGFALVDHFAVQRLTSLNSNMKDAVQLGIGVVLTLAGAGFNKLWLSELGAAYGAVPVARLTQRNGLGGIPIGEVSIGQAMPSQFPAGVVSDGRTGAVATTVAGVKTF